MRKNRWVDFANHRMVMSPKWRDFRLPKKQRGKLYDAPTSKLPPATSYFEIAWLQLTRWPRNRTGTENRNSRNRFPGTDSRTGTNGSVFQESSPEAELPLLLKPYAAYGHTSQSQIYTFISLPCQQNIGVKTLLAQRSDIGEE